MAPFVGSNNGGGITGDQLDDKRQDRIAADLDNRFGSATAMRLSTEHIRGTDLRSRLLPLGVEVRRTDPGTPQLGGFDPR